MEGLRDRTHNVETSPVSIKGIRESIDASIYYRLCSEKRGVLVVYIPECLPLVL